MVGRSKRDDERAQAACRRADTGLVEIRWAIHELIPDDIEFEEEFYKFAKMLARKLKSKVSAQAIKDGGNNRGSYWDTENITQWLGDHDER
jgi:hypothetical protein